MSDGTHIEWTDATWNILTGCSVVSAGCKHCYAMKLAGTRLKNHRSRVNLTQMTEAGPVWNGRIRFNVEWLEQPLNWSRARRIFVCAHGDLFHEHVEEGWIVDVFAIMAMAQQHSFQVLTKRPGRAHALLNHTAFWREVRAVAAGLAAARGRQFVLADEVVQQKFLNNVWLGTSIENQAACDERVPHLIDTPAAVRFLSCEPLLGPISFHGRWCQRGVVHENWLNRIGWMIVGGESGQGARPMHPDWARTLRDECAALEVAFFFKQWGEYLPAGQDGNPDHEPQEVNASTVAVKVGKKRAGRLLDGREHSEYPK